MILGILSGPELKKAREEIGQSVNGMAHILGCNERTLRRWEDGTQDIPRAVSALVRILTDHRCPPWVDEIAGI